MKPIPKALVDATHPVVSRDGVSIFHADVLDLYDWWESPVVIISDGPYGVAGFPGDPPRPEGLPAWYEPHIAAWSRKATPITTLWFWNTELGWANVHPVLVRHGWTYRACHVWDKGIAHAAGNSNTRSLRKLPIVTEVCVQYVKEADFGHNGKPVSMQEWLRSEWERTGLPFYQTNEACRVRNAATRKYFTKCHLWYYPPVEAFEQLVAYANKYGRKSGRPYFSIDGKKPVTAKQWTRMRAKFYCEPGFTNVWRQPAVRGVERLKNGSKCIHTNQKPLRLVELSIRLSSDPGDLVWEPFGGLCSGAIASHRLKRRCVSAEVVKEFFDVAAKRLETHDATQDTSCSG
jgi:site-specific DNA-methyltransferase (adenine-specific)